MAPHLSQVGERLAVDQAEVSLPSAVSPDVRIRPPKGNGLDF
jgi:hypothetical protein